MEQWRKIPGYEGLYQVSDLGNVKSVFYKRRGQETILKPILRRGYLCVELCKDKKKKKYSIHRLVWEGFNGPIPEGMQVNHINEDKTDNRLENLNLMSPKENINWGTGVKRQSKSREKAIEQYSLSGELIKWYQSAAAVVAENNGVWNENTIRDCCRRHKKTAYGFFWRYAV